MNAPELEIRTERLTKRYGDTVAVDNVDLAIPRGRFFGLLGPNGAGKTSTIHMLSTLIQPTSGEGWVGGHSITSHKLDVRRSIGVVFQETALDRSLSAAENLRFAGRLNNLSRAQIEQRSAELLQLVGLREKRDIPVAALSGGMRRALDIARGVIHQPHVLFLDEPTTGLDVSSRRAIWRHIARLRSELAITVFLTTHYLEEAIDCDEVAFLRSGRIVRSGAPRLLVEQLGAYVLEIETDRAAEAVERLSPRLGPALVEGDIVHFRCNTEIGELLALQAEWLPRARAVRWRRPNLNDVYLWVTNASVSMRRAA